MQGGGFLGEVPRHPVSRRSQVLVDEATALRRPVRRWEASKIDSPSQAWRVVVQEDKGGGGGMFVWAHGGVQVVVMGDAAEAAQVR